MRASIAQYEQRVMEPAAELRAEMCKTIGDSMDGKSAAYALAAYIATLEKAMAQRLSGHSLYFWLHLARRWPIERIGDSSAWTTKLVRQVFLLAVLKHSSVAVNDVGLVRVGDTGRAVLGPLVEKDILDLARVEYLAYELNHAASAFRRVGKGATLTVVSEDLRAVASDEVQKLIATQDRRVASFSSFSGPFGTDVSVELPAAVKPGDTPPFALTLRLNVAGEGGDSIARFAGARFKSRPNYTPHGLALAPIRKALAPFELELEESVGATVDAVLATVFGLSVHSLRVMSEHPEVAFKLLTTGYYPFTHAPGVEALCRDIAPYVQHWWKTQRDEDIDATRAEEIAGATIEALTDRPSDLASIDLWARTPPSLFVDAGSWLVFDIAAIGDVLTDLFRHVGYIEGDPGSLRGSAFETQVVERAAEYGFSLWRKGGITGADAAHREIDASFIAGTTLFLVECKAVSKTRWIELGDYASTLNRWSNFENGYLVQARTLQEFVESRRDDPTVAVPSEVTDFEHVVCTPAVEWIPDAKSYLWLTQSVPRVCTPDELVELLETAAKREPRGRSSLKPGSRSPSGG